MSDGARYTLTVSEREKDPTALPMVTAAFEGSHGLAIAQISTKDDHTGSYWVDAFGGTIDTPDADSSWVIGNRYLQRVATREALTAVPWSYYVDTVLEVVWIRTDPYAYAFDAPAGANRAESQLRFSSSVADPTKPSDDTIDGVRYPTRLKIPQTPLKLSTPTHGVSVSDITNFTIYTPDGLLDDNIDKVIHSRVQLRKSYGGGTLKTIYVGEVMDLRNDFDSIQIKCSQRYGGLTQAATKTIGEVFGAALERYDIEDGAEGKPCPRVYGYAAGVPLVKLGPVSGDPLTVGYVFHDPTARTGTVSIEGFVFDDGTKRSASIGTVTAAGIVEVAFLEQYVEFADVVTRDAIDNDTYTAPTAIRDILTDRAGIPVDSSSWDLDELSETVQASELDIIGTVIDGGTVRNAVDGFTKNGLYHLLETPDGRFTIRIFGREYSTWVVPEWIHTKNPTVSYYDGKLLTTSSRVKWREALTTDPSTEDGAQRWAVYDREEALLVTEGGRGHRLELETDLAVQSSADGLAQDLVGYFGSRLKTVDAWFGDDLSEITQLDKIETTILINGRLLLPGDSYIVADIDRAQDKVLLISTADFGTVTDIHETGNRADEIHETGIEENTIEETGVRI